MLTILPDRSRATLGNHSPEGVFFYPGEGHENRNKKIAQENVTHLCARCAALVGAGYSDTKARIGCDSDFDKAQEQIKAWLLPGFSAQLRKAKEFMRRPENVKAVARLAEELMDKEVILGDEIPVLVNVSDKVSTEEELEHYRINGQIEQLRSKIINAKSKASR